MLETAAERRSWAGAKVNLFLSVDGLWVMLQQQRVVLAAWHRGSVPAGQGWGAITWVIDAAVSDAASLANKAGITGAACGICRLQPAPCAGRQQERFHPAQAVDFQVQIIDFKGSENTA